MTNSGLFPCPIELLALNWRALTSYHQLRIGSDKEEANTIK